MWGRCTNAQALEHELEDVLIEKGMVKQHVFLRLLFGIEVSSATTFDVFDTGRQECQECVQLLHLKNWTDQLALFVNELRNVECASEVRPLQSSQIILVGVIVDGVEHLQLQVAFSFMRAPSLRISSILRESSQKAEKESNLKGFEDFASDVRTQFL